MNSCETGRALSCSEGYVIKIHDVRHMPVNYTCEEREKIIRLCDGLRSCSNIDLRRQLHFYCKDYPEKRVVTSFQCIPDSTKQLCRTNVCSEESRDVRCRRGRVFHLLSVKCFHGNSECSSEYYNVIYRKCEGQRSCPLADLRLRLPSKSCDNAFIQQANVFMDYICVDNAVVTDKCLGTFMTLMPKFGIMASPGYPNNREGNEHGCYWAVYPGGGEEVDVTVHLAYSKEGREDCNSRFLQVQYTDCENKHQKTDRFCDVGRVNVKIHSCGTVYIMHWPYLPGSNRGNRFLVSYSVKSPADKLEPYEQYAYRCERIEPETDRHIYTPQPLDPDVTSERNKTATNRTVLPEDQPINDSSVLSPEESPDDKKKTNHKKSDPWKMITLLRVVVVNIFLGLLIIALIMALAFVCYRYKTVGRKKKKTPTSGSNTATTLDDKTSTEMQLLSPDDDRDHPINDNNTATLSRAVPEMEPLKQTTPCHVISYNPEVVQYNRSSVADEKLFYDSSTGVSSFLLPDKSTDVNLPESAYSSLDLDSHVMHNEDVNKQNRSSRCSEIRFSNPNPIHTQDGVRDRLQHYKVQGDEYAIVARSPEHAHSPSQSGKAVGLLKGDHCNTHHTKGHYSNIDHTKGHYSNTDPRKGRHSQSKPVAHIHPVPEHDQNSTMQVIPQHECLLHKIPPPPPPARPSAAQMGKWGSMVNV